MDILTNPYVIIAIVLAVIISNIMAIKYTANSKFGIKNKDDKEETKNSSDSSEKKKQSGYDDEDDDKSSFL